MQSKLTQHIYQIGWRSIAAGQQRYAGSTKAFDRQMISCNREIQFSDVGCYVTDLTVVCVTQGHIG